MGLSSKKQKSTTKQNETATTTPTVAPWLDQTYQGYAGKVTDFLKSDPSKLVPGANALQQQAFSAAGQLGGQGRTFDDAIGLAKTAAAAPASTYTAPTLAGPQSVSLSGYAAPQLGPVSEAGAESLLDGFDNYLDPATQQLVDAALRNYDAQSGRQAAALQAQQARTGAFGGSRAGVAQGEFAAGTDRGRALTEAELRTQAFAQATQMANADAGRRQDSGFFNAGAQNTRTLAQGGMDEAAARYAADARNQGSVFNAGAANQFALTQGGMDAEAARFNAAAEEAAINRMLSSAGLVGNLGATQAADQRADIGLAADLGEMARMIEAAQAGAPLAQLQAAGQLYGLIPAGAYTGQQVNSSGTSTNVTKSSPSLFDQALAAASVASAFSDPRLKKDVELIGAAGPFGLYAFRYMWDSENRPKRFGVMADEVERLLPQALGPRVAGYLTVDYAKLGLAELTNSLRSGAVAAVATVPS